MSLLMTASQIRGLPVVTIRGGEDLAEVRDVIYSPEAGQLVGFTLNQRGFLGGRLTDMLSVPNLHAIGQDAVMIMDEAALLSPAESTAELGDFDKGRNVIGDDVLTERGVSLGKVSDLVVVVGGTGSVVGYQIEKTAGGPGYIPLPAQLSVSGVALVVPDLTEEFVHDDLVGLGAAVDQFRTRLGLP